MFVLFLHFNSRFANLFSERFTVVALTPRERELDWMEKNKAELEQLKGKWLAIEGEELVASSFNILNVIEETKRRGISLPFLIYVPEEMQRNTMGIVS